MVGILMVGVAGASIYNNKNLQKFCSCNFCDFSNCLFSYSPCADALAYPATPPYQNKNTPFRGYFYFWWEWLDSNQLRLKPTDLQSAPALQLRRTPELFRHYCCGLPHEAMAKCGAGSGNRTRISSLEGLHTSLCTMPATNSKLYDYILL